MLLSIVIPSKNNSKYLRSAVNGFIAIADILTSEVELVIADNSDCPDQTISSIRHEQVFYHWSGLEMDILANFDSGVKMARGEYVTIIGDDDFILPKIVYVARELKHRSIDSAMAELSTYYWPGVNTHWLGVNETGVLEIHEGGWGGTEYSVVSGLNDVLRFGGTRYISLLPSVYHGMVKRNVLLNLQQTYGTAFPGPSPDISNAILLGLTGVSCYEVDSFIVSGAAVGSAAAEGASHSHHGSLNERTSFLKRGRFSWPDIVPPVFCGPTMWAVSVINTLRTSGNARLIDDLNLYHLHAAVFTYHPQYKKVTFKSLQSLGLRNLLSLALEVSVVIQFRVQQYLCNLFKYKINSRRTTRWTVRRNIHDTSEVAKYVASSA